MATLERITDTTEEINVEAVFPRTDIASKNMPEQGTPTRPQIPDLSEDQIEELSELGRIFPWMLNESSDELLELRKYLPWISAEVVSSMEASG